MYGIYFRYKLLFQIEKVYQIQKNSISNAKNIYKIEYKTLSQ